MASIYYFVLLFCDYVNILFRTGVYTMITTEDVLNMNFYKKEKFTGSYKGMRYLLKKDTEEISSDIPDTPPETKTIFRCYAWWGPYNFVTTPDHEKLTAIFDFSAEGKQQAVNWLNEQWAAHENRT